MTTEKTSYGTLYLVATPIGNLEDMTPRAIRMLKEADIIAAEDTRHTLQLLNHFDIKGRLVRYDEHSKEKQGAYLLAELTDGKNVALVSDAGFPGIADPGEALAKEAIDAGIRVVPVPGANAALCALIASGLPAYPFFFGGFLPKSRRNRKEQLDLWKHIPATIILYEAPHRIKEVLQDILECWGDRPMAAARELTKLHEEIIRTTLSEAIKKYTETAPKGEFVLVLAGAPEVVKEEASATDAAARVAQLMEEGMSRKDAVKQTAKELDLPKNVVYDAALKLNM